MTSSAALAQVALANAAASAVLEDLHRTASLRPTVVVEADDGEHVHIWVNGGFQLIDIQFDLRDVLVAVADYFQDELASELGCWPVCDQHDVGLHGEVHDGVAVWWCRLDHHAVAPIGELGS